MTTLKGPGIFLAQFMGDEPPFDNLKSICKWAASLGYVGVQIPSWDARYIDLKKAAESKDYADEIRETVELCGLKITELSTHLQGQLVAVNPAYDTVFDAFAPKSVRGKTKERTAWAVDQLKLAAKASKNLGLNAHATFSGALMWQTVYPWPQRPAGLVEDGFKELAKRWLPILNAFDKVGVDVCTKSIRAKTCTMGSPSSVFGKPLAATSVATCCTTPVIFYCSNSITCSTSTSIILLSKCFTSKMPSSTPLARVAYTVAIKSGSTDPVASVRWVMVK